MKDINNNTDRVFREKLGDFRQKPPEEIWGGIKAGLGKKSRSLILIPLWQAAAGVALLITAGSIFYYLNRPAQNMLAEQVLVVPGNTQSTVQLQKTDSGEFKSDKVPVFNSETKSEIISSIHNSKLENAPLVKPEMVNDIILSENLPVTFSEDIKSNPGFDDRFSIELMTGSYLQPVPEDALPLNNKTFIASWEMLTAEADLEMDNDKENKRLSLTAQASPTYSYRDIGNIGGGGSEQFNQYESGRISYSGGLQLGFKTSERLSIHTGLMYAQLGYNINNVERFDANSIETGTDIITIPGENSTVYIANQSIGTINPSSEKGTFIASNSVRNNDKSGNDYINGGVSKLDAGRKNRAIFSIPRASVFVEI
jgi:hypothetical protein